MRRLLIVLALLLVPVAARAQAITQVIHTVYTQGTNNVAQTATLTFPTGWQCGRKPKVARPTVTQVNPSQIVVDDPNDATSDCVFTDSLTSNGGLFSLPFGATVYESAVKYVNSVGASPEGARSNLFTRPGAAPPAPTGTRIVRLLLSGKTVFGFRTRRARPQFLYLVGDKRR